jgi:hypothetical protein
MNCLRSHLPALICAPTTRLRALLTVLVLMLAALVATRLADLCAQLAQLLGKVTAARHVAGCQSADCGAIHVEGDAARHHVDVLPLQTRGCAMVAGMCAAAASFDAGLVLLVSHLELLRSSKGRRRGMRPGTVKLAATAA